MGRLLIQFPGTTTAKALTETLSKNVIIVDEDLHQLRLHDGSTAGGHLIGGSSGSGVPVGTIIPFAGNSIPQGYLLCDGSAISRTTYASLFAVIGTIYGAGDGNSTFNLPNLIDRTPWYDTNPHYSRGESHNGELPNIRGDTEAPILTQNASTNPETQGSGGFYFTNASQPVLFGGSVARYSGILKFDASRINNIVFIDNIDHVKPSRLYISGWYIKY